VHDELRVRAFRKDSRATIGSDLERGQQLLKLQVGHVKQLAPVRFSPLVGLNTEAKRSSSPTNILASD